MAHFRVTLHDPTLSRGWLDLDNDDGNPAKPTNTSILEVSADDANAAKEFALAQNPGLEVQGEPEEFNPEQ